MDINSVWPEWHEDCLLGEGSFGKVYRAKRVEYGRTFYSAIKVLSVPKTQQEIKHARSQGMNDTEIRAYFCGIVENLLNEITMMDSLKGAKNIVGIEDYKIVEHTGEIGWDIFIRMELLTPFDSFISNPEFSQKDVIRLGLDICAALEVCEQSYIVHRDIKPDNIFVSRFGEYKLGDFGIARKLETTQANLSRKGTLNYMAPEIYKCEEYGPSVDIYSLGLVLYTLLNNNRVAFLPPYPAPITYTDNENALNCRLMGNPLPLPCNAAPSLGAVVVKACAYNPYDRYTNATEFKNALLVEWNNLVQNGDVRGINNTYGLSDGNYPDPYGRTTNDMTANGKIVVSDPGLNTNNNINNYYDNSLSNANAFDITNYHVNENVRPVNSRTNKFCRILAYPAGIISVLLSFISFGTASGVSGVFPVGSSVIAVCLAILISNANKYSVGIATMGMSVVPLFMGITEIIASLKSGFEIYSVVLLITGLLLLFSGIVVLTQKEVRLGGSLIIYVMLIQWIYNIYMIVNAYNLTSPIISACFTSGCLTLFLWSFGYDSCYKPEGIKKILFFISIPVSVILTIISVITGIF